MPSAWEALKIGFLFGSGWSLGTVIVQWAIQMFVGWAFRGSPMPQIGVSGT